MLRYGVGTCPIQLLIRMIPMVMQNCLRYNSTFSTIFASYKWALRYVTTHSMACLIFPSRSQCIGSHLNRAHGRSMEPFISGRKSSARMDGCNLKPDFSTRWSKCFTQTGLPDWVKPALPMNLFTGDLLWTKLLKEFEPYYRQFYGTLKSPNGCTKLWLKIFLGPT